MKEVNYEVEKVESNAKRMLAYAEKIKEKIEKTPKEVKEEE